MGVRVDLSGYVFGRWTVLEYGYTDRKGYNCWKCRCHCGQIKIIRGVYLRSGDSKSCGCLQRERTVEASRGDLTGKRFGRLFVLGYAYTKGKIAYWLCLCDCGNTKIICSGSLTQRCTKSCGCLQKEMATKLCIKNNPGTRLFKGEAAFNRVFKQYQRNAQNRGIPFLLTKIEFRILAGGNCNYCGPEPSTLTSLKICNGQYIHNGVDRVDNSKGYIKGNVVSCCGTCNRMKMDRTQKEFLLYIKRIYENLNLGEL